ncbi:MAG TPA: Clp protease ClpP [Gammaproteobacteria bacterium]|nr:Clp protease ClpP [Gammaproteobacteria bacterium]
MTTKPHKYWEIRNAGKGTAEVLIYGDIGESWWTETVDAQTFVKELQELDVQNLIVRINSYGGSVKDGIAIHNAIRRHAADTEVIIDGMAVSIASLIAMAGDTVSMAENAMMMIHAPWAGIYGNAKEMREYADVLDKHAEAMATSYARKTGKPAEEMLALLTDGEDHWYTAEEALAENLIDQIDEASDLDMAASLNKTRFKIPTAAATRAARDEQAATAAANPKEEKPMSDKTQQAAEKTAEIEAKARKEALAAEKQRRDDVRALFKPAFMQHDGMSDLLNACLDDPDITPQDAQARILEKLAEGAEPIAGMPPATAGESAEDKFRIGAVAALSARAGLEKREDASNEFRGLTLLEMAGKVLSMHGKSPERMNKMDRVAAALTHTSGDFGNLLSNVAEKAMLKGYDEAEETFQSWTNKGELPDFKPASRVDLNSFPSLQQVREGAEYRYATVGDRGETIQLATYGSLFSITRQAIINDDLGAFTRIPAKMGRAAIRTVGDLVYAVLTSNPAMSDGTALFHANHKNLLTGASIMTETVDKMRVAMATQKDSTAKGATALNIRLAHLIVPVALEGTAKVVAESEFKVGGNEDKTIPNSVRGTFDVIADARLDADSATAWYGAAAAGMHDVIEVAYLDGNDMPYLEQQQGWTVDGAEFKVRMDAAVKALDFRTLAKNPGA